MRAGVSSVQVDGTGVLALGAAVGIAFLGIWLWTKREAIKQAIDPTSDKNLAYQGANAITQAVTGRSDATLGTAIYDRLHTDTGQFAWWRLLPGGDALEKKFNPPQFGPAAAAGTPATPPSSPSSSDLSNFWGI